APAEEDVQVGVGGVPRPVLRAPAPARPRAAGPRQMVTGLHGLAGQVRVDGLVLRSPEGLIRVPLVRILFAADVDQVVLVVRVRARLQPAGRHAGLQEGTEALQAWSQSWLGPSRRCM